MAKLASIPCPSCKAKAKVPADKISEKGLTYTCPGCKIKIQVKKTDKGVSVRKVGGGAEEAFEAKVEEQKIIIGAPTWIVTFADLATLLLTFFVLMLSFANMDVIKFQELMGSVQEAYGVTMKEHGDFQAVSSGQLEEVDSNIQAKSAAVVARERLVNVVADVVVRQGFKSDASITSTDEGVRVRIKGRALFMPGKSTLRPKTQKFLKELAQVIKLTKNIHAVVEGHTDNSKIKTKKFPSNWELSVLRAANVLEMMLKYGAPADRMSTAGYADTRPLFPNDRPETRPLNRRVEFLFKRG